MNAPGCLADTSRMALAGAHFPHVEAAAAWFLRSRPWLTETDRDDLVSEGLFALVEAAGRYESGHSARAAFWTFARPRVVGQMRRGMFLRDKHAARFRGADGAEPAADARLRPDSIVECQDSIDALLLKVAPAEKAVIDLFLQGHETARIAKTLGVAQSTVRNHIKHVRERFAPAGIDKGQRGEARGSVA